MDLLSHLGQTLDELDAPRWPDASAGSTQLVRKVHALRRVPLGELRAADLRVLVSQQVALAYVVPLAVRLLLEEPLLDAYYYEGDLLLTTVNVPAPVWDLFPELARELRDAVARLPEGAFAGLPRGATEEIGRFLASAQRNS
ncbi:MULTISPECIES: contact-dependent growth inhibition system immunity protein [unclassified Streptomyces]|uniref:contact-dependent growth inhibition system immunity protein n=1 Tax=unclassified Streptomyces TaxID=2593676 RepID=UPI000DAE1733|nr:MULTISPECIES: contact-dependent growth inhibition system immunity protein [unclassified Streptomyces]PZT74766.1 hypothetical protein DNK55_22140 [Streptomyces sp. AC1-42T]PZT82248.1 hypothetical protein DNK56_09305 [Streptomyces sp. AC1-42W]